MSEKKKIMVVEDNDFVRMQIVKFLTDEGHDVVEKTDGEAALEAIGQGVDMAIVDVRMEPMDGFDFIRAIRAMDMKTPVILVTGDNNPELLNDAAKLGVVAVLMKPVQKDRLLKIVARTIQVMARAS